MEKKAGFTLVEVMIVIAVFAIMAAVAIPTFMSLLPGMRLNGATRQVASDLMAARMKAVKLNQRTKVSFGSTGYGYEIWNDADNSGAVADNEGDDVERSIHPDYHDVTFNTVSTVFSPRGTATNRTITLQNTSGSTKSITISIAGRVKIN